MRASVVSGAAMVTGTKPSDVPVIPACRRQTVSTLRLTPNCRATSEMQARAPPTP